MHGKSRSCGWYQWASWLKPSGVCKIKRHQFKVIFSIHTVKAFLYFGGAKHHTTTNGCKKKTMLQRSEIGAVFLLTHTLSVTVMSGDDRVKGPLDLISTWAEIQWQM